MGTDCKSAAFSFGGSNPPAPTKKTSTYASTLRFLFCDRAKLIGRVDSNSIGDVVEDSAKTAPMDRQVHRGCCYTMILLTLTFS